MTIWKDPGRLNRFRLGLVSATLLYTLNLILILRWQDDVAAASAILGAASGWVIGTFISPYEATEDRRFGSFAKLASAVLTGFLLSKVDKLFDLVFPHLSDERFVRRLMVGVSCFLPTMIMVYVARQYFGRPEENPHIHGETEAEMAGREARSEEARKDAQATTA